MCSFFDKLILYNFLIFLNKVLEFLNFLIGLILVSYKPVSYKKCVPQQLISTRSNLKKWNFVHASDYSFSYLQEKVHVVAICKS